MWGQDFCGGRSQEPGVSSALSQQAELISQQLQELRRLEEEVRSLRETSLQQKTRLETQAVELDALAVAEKAGQAEVKGLRTALAGAEMVRKNLEEAKQRELEEIQGLHQEQIQPLDPLEPEFPKKCRSLLRSWREKVFALMVQLKAQDLQHRDSTTQLKDQVRAASLSLSARTQCLAQ